MPGMSLDHQRVKIRPRNVSLLWIVENGYDK